MNPDEVEAAKDFLFEENKKWPASMKPIEPRDWSPSVKFLKNKPIFVWRSRYYFAQLYRTSTENILRLSINRAALGIDGSWVDGITWDELMRVKAQCGYGNHWAVEVYPADTSIVNISNIRHLFIAEDGTAPEFAWRKKGED